MSQFFQDLVHEFQLPLHNPVLVFSLILLIILLAPILLRKLNIPGIIGLILAGVAIGPFGFGVLEKSSAIELFSTIGLLYIMFIAGLELDMNEFKANKNKSLLFGFFTFILPLSIGFPVCFYFLGYDFNASFLTASMFATHTLVTYPIVSKLGISKNQAVAVTVGGTILTDTAVLLILAVVMGNANGGLNQEFFVRLLISLSIFSAIMFFLIPRIAAWFFRKLESEKHSHYIFVLAVVFFASFLAEVAGVEPIIGAFVAGLALNKLVPHSSALMNRIEFIGNALFIPFFLISVGMLVDVRVILSGPGAWLVAATLSLVAIFGKWIAAWLTSLSFGYNSPQRQLIFGLSSAHAAATLAVILVGYKAEILDDNILNGTIILILITCIVASFATERAGKKLLGLQNGAEGEETTLPTAPNEHLLLPIANQDNFSKQLEFAILIKDKRSSNPISVLSVVSNNSQAEDNIRRARNKLEEFVKQGSAAEAKVNVITTIDHHAASGIARISREVMADIIILGWPQRTGIVDKLVGDTTYSLINLVEKSLFISNFTQPLVALKRILVAAPPLAEHEKGFGNWMGKLGKLALELNIPLHLFCNRETHQAIVSFCKKHKLNPPMKWEEFSLWEDFLILSKYLEITDLFVFVSARKGAVSYQSVLDGIPTKMDRHFVDFAKMVIYPQAFDHQGASESYADVSGDALNKGLEVVGKFTRGLSALLNPEDANKNNKQD